MSRAMNTLRLSVAAACILAVAACSSDPVPTDSYYRLGAAAPVSPIAGGPLPGTVEVPPLRAEGIVNDRALLYREGNVRLAQYSYHFWEKPPAALLQQALIEALRKAEAFQTVATPELRLNREYELMGRVQRFEHVMGSGTVSVQIEFTLRRMRGGEPLLMKTYTSEQGGNGTDVMAAVEAFTKAQDAIFAELLSDIAALPRS